MSTKVGEEKKKAGGKEPPRGLARPAAKPSTGQPYRPLPYPYEVRKRAVQLYLEEGIEATQIAREMGLSDGTIYEWAKRYRTYGEAGLRDPVPQSAGPRLPVAVQAKITELKREDPRHGVKRISQILRRFFFLKASPETVRQHLKTAAIPPVKPKGRKKPKPPKPKRFERSTPNQMWQSDITDFRVQGKTAHIIGFLDDYSRFVTGLGVFRSALSPYVVDVYREAVAAYGVPQEMLTDNGPQYASWRGKTQFQKELERDHVKHIRSTPHHPQTLGKIERFWQTLKDEFLKRAKFDSLEEARERIGYWVKHYNHRRTHQSMEGMCPADRFFQIHKELRATIERGVAANVEELALRGKPVEPFYMVGRMGEQSVVIETDKKRMSVLVDGKTMAAGQPLVYELQEGDRDETGTGRGNGSQKAAESDVQREGKSASGAGAVERAAEPVGDHEGIRLAVGGDQRMGETGAFRNAHGAGPDVEAGGGGSAEPAEAGGETDRTDGETGRGGSAGGDGELKQEGNRNEDHGTGSVRGGGEMPGGAGGLDGTQSGVGVVPGDGGERLAVLPVAGPGAFGYAGGTGAAGNEGGIGRTGAVGPGQATAGPQGARAGTGGPGPERELESTPGAQQGAAADSTLDRRRLLNGEVIGVERATGGREDARPAAGDSGGTGGTDERHAGGLGTGDQPQDVLRVAGAGAFGDARGAEGPARRPAAAAGGPAEGAPAGDGRDPGKGTAGSGGAAADPGGDPGNVERPAAGAAA